MVRGCVRGTRSTVAVGVVEEVNFLNPNPKNFDWVGVKGTTIQGISCVRPHKTHIDFATGIIFDSRAERMGHRCGRGGAGSARFLTPPPPCRRRRPPPAAAQALFRVFREQVGAKCVYIAPLKALVKERMLDWGASFPRLLGQESRKDLLAHLR